MKQTLSANSVERYSANPIFRFTPCLQVPATTPLLRARATLRICVDTEGTSALHLHSPHTAVQSRTSHAEATSGELASGTSIHTAQLPFLIQTIRGASKARSTPQQPHRYRAQSAYDAIRDRRPHPERTSVAPLSMGTTATRSPNVFPHRDAELCVRLTTTYFPAESARRVGARRRSEPISARKLALREDATGFRLARRQAPHAAASWRSQAVDPASMRRIRDWRDRYDVGRGASSALRSSASGESSRMRVPPPPRRSTSLAGASNACRRVFSAILCVPYLQWAHSVRDRRQRSLRRMKKRSPSSRGKAPHGHDASTSASISLSPSTRVPIGLLLPTSPRASASRRRTWATSRVGTSQPTCCSVLSSRCHRPTSSSRTSGWWPPRKRRPPVGMTAALA